MLTDGMKDFLKACLVTRGTLQCLQTGSIEDGNSPNMLLAVLPVLSVKSDDFPEEIKSL